MIWTNVMSVLQVDKIWSTSLLKSRSMSGWGSRASFCTFGCWSGIECKKMRHVRNILIIVNLVTETQVANEGYSKLI